MSRAVLGACVVVALAAVAGLGVWLARAPADARGFDSRDPAFLAMGRQVYESRCAACHGDRLQGQPDWQVRRADGRLPAPPHDASGHTWHHPDEVLFNLVKHGVQRYAGAGYASDMPAYDGVLRDEEIVAVLAWIKSTWPPAVRARQAEMDRAHRQSGR